MRRGRHQLAADAVTPVLVAQPGEGQRWRRDQRFRQRPPLRQADILQAADHLPAADLQAEGAMLVFRRRRPAAVVVEHRRHGLAHGDVVVVAHLRLAVLERAHARLALGEEQVGVGVARGVQVGVDARHGGIAPVGALGL
ncbi:hypothetical protein, partial [Amnimonas aquatica]|uniref:hypothetical protein n=1 Tax=Amnimonas aquatica TaxID=2094561 RepID=UPI001F14FEB2